MHALLKVRSASPTTLCRKGFSSVLVLSSSLQAVLTLYLPFVPSAQWITGKGRDEEMSPPPELTVSRFNSWFLLQPQPAISKYEIFNHTQVQANSSSRKQQRQQQQQSGEAVASWPAASRERGLAGGEQQQNLQTREAVQPLRTWNPSETAKDCKNLSWMHFASSFVSKG